MTDDSTSQGPGSNEPDEMITRGELCRAADVSKSTIRRWEEKGLLHPLIDERGVRLFRVADVQALIGKKPVVHLPKARALVPSAATARGELAADVFERLDRGVEGADIVKELRVHPDVVSGFMARWEQLRGGVYLTKDACSALVRMTSSAPARSAREVVGAVKRALKQGRCVSCETGRPSYCESCVRQHSRALKARYAKTSGLGADSR